MNFRFNRDKLFIVEYKITVIFNSHISNQIHSFCVISEPLYGLPEWKDDTVVVNPQPKPVASVEEQPSDLKANLPPIANRQAWFTAFNCTKKPKKTTVSQTRKAPKPTHKHRPILKAKSVKTISKADKAEKFQIQNLVLQNILGQCYSLSCSSKRQREDAGVVSMQNKRHH